MRDAYFSRMPDAEVLPHVADRLRELRLRGGLGQAELAKRMGLASRQALSDIERHRRDLKEGDLRAAAHALGVPASALLSPWAPLDPEATHVHLAPDCREADRAGAMASAHAQVERLLDAVRTLGPPQGMPRLALPLTERATTEIAWAAAEQMSARLGLGGRPARRVAPSLELVCGIRVVVLDLPRQIESVSAHCLDGQFIVLASHRDVEHHALDIAHHLFHLLTWFSLPTRRVEVGQGAQPSGRTAERLAVQFAGALLLPRLTVAAQWTRQAEETRAEWIVRSAREMQVPPEMVGERVVALGLLSRTQWERLGPLTAAREAAGNTPPPARWSTWFLGRLAGAIVAGRLTMREAEEMTGMTKGEILQACGDTLPPPTRL